MTRASRAVKATDRGGQTCSLPGRGVMGRRRRLYSDDDVSTIQAPRLAGQIALLLFVLHPKGATLQSANFPVEVSPASRGSQVRQVGVLEPATQTVCVCVVSRPLHLPPLAPVVYPVTNCPIRGRWVSCFHIHFHLRKHAPSPAQRLFLLCLLCLPVLASAIVVAQALSFCVCVVWPAVLLLHVCTILACMSRRTTAALVPRQPLSWCLELTAVV